jgi:hypothetical protein
MEASCARSRGNVTGVATTWKDPATGNVLTFRGASIDVFETGIIASQWDYCDLPDTLGNSESPSGMRARPWNWHRMGAYAARTAFQTRDHCCGTARR